MPEESVPPEMSAEGQLASLEPPKAPAVPPPPPIRSELPKRDRMEAPTALRAYRRMGLAYMVPASLMVPIVLLTVLGSWLDGQLASREQVWTIGGALLGTVIGFVHMVRTVRSLGR